MKHVRVAVGERVTVNVDDLNEFQGDLKTLSITNYERAKQSIDKLGFSFVPHAWRDGEKLFILDGHQRVRALKKMKSEGYIVPQIPVMLVDAANVTEAKQKVLAAASQYGEITADGLYEFIETNDLNFDSVVELNRFPEIDFDSFRENFYDSPAPGAGGDSIPDNIPKRAAAGDVWLLGKHIVMCGDSTKIGDVKKLMGMELADMVFTSPPYNVGIKYNEYDDKKSVDEYTNLVESVMRNCFAVMNPGRLIAWNVGVSPKSKPYFHAMLLEKCGFDFYRHIVWKKTGAQIPLWHNSQKKPNARYYMPNYNHELIYMASKGQVEVGAKTDMPEELSMDVWDVSQFAAGGNNHPAAFPVHLAKHAIHVMSAPGELVFEPFCGSGSVIIAAHDTGRVCRAMEIDPHYLDVTIARWEEHTRERAKKISDIS